MRSAKMLFFPNSRDGHSYGLSLPFPGAQRAVMESIFILSPFIHGPNIWEKRPDSVTFSGSYCITGENCGTDPLLFDYYGVLLLSCRLHMKTSLFGGFGWLAHR